MNAVILTGPILAVLIYTDTLNLKQFQNTFLIARRRRLRPAGARATERDGDVPAERVVRKELDGGRGNAVEVSPFFCFGKFSDSVRGRLRGRVEMLNQENLVALLVVKQLIDKFLGH